MIDSLADAWRWYESVRKLTRGMSRLGRKYWDDLPWEGALGRDEQLRGLEALEIQERSEDVLRDLDDLCVLLLFSVFEAIVRTRIHEDVEAELRQPQHPALQHALRNLHESIEHGSFFRLLEAYKGWAPDLIEEVNQVRQYRNWVAHGRRGEPANAVDPWTAYDRLQRFLERLNAPPSGEPATDAPPG
jgi:hypothetical protein